MNEPVIHATFVLERAFNQPLERTFAAFCDPDQKRAWYADGDDREEGEYALDFRLDGTERASYRMGRTTPLPGARMESQATFLDIQPLRRIVFVQHMSLEGRRFSAALITLEFLADTDGTRLVLTHQGAFFEHADKPEMREHGWAILLQRAADFLTTHAA